jgi:hypothetical protein
MWVAAQVGFTRDNDSFRLGECALLGYLEDGLLQRHKAGSDIDNFSGAIIAALFKGLAPSASERFHFINSFKIAEVAEPSAIPARPASYIH